MTEGPPSPSPLRTTGAQFAGSALLHIAVAMGVSRFARKVVGTETFAQPLHCNAFVESLNLRCQTLSVHAAPIAVSNNASPFHPTSMAVAEPHSIVFFCMGGLSVRGVAAFIGKQGISKKAALFNPQPDHYFWW